MTDGGRYVYCNGRGHEATTSSVEAGKQHGSSRLGMNPRSVTNRHMNWLIHGLYSRKLYGHCKKLIDRQLAICYDKEYLHYMKGFVAYTNKNGQLYV